MRTAPRFRGRESPDQPGANAGQRSAGIEPIELSGARNRARQGEKVLLTSYVTTLCENIDLRPSCRSGSWMLVPSRTDSEQYELLSTAPIWIEDYAEGPKTQHHYAHVGVDPWLCHRWDEPRNLYEKSICGVALAEDGNLGGCIPEGHGGIICGWQPPCPELV